MPLHPVPKPQKKSKTKKRQDALDKRVNHYGGSDDWRALKERVFARDRWRCVVCGADNPKDGVQLEAAHLDAVGMGGRQSHDEDRIVTLCRPCHHQVDQGVHREEWRVAIDHYLHELAIRNRVT